MDLPGINNTMGLSLDAARSSASSEKLNQLAETVANPDESHEELVKAARQFEGVFLNTLMKAMRKTVPDNELFNAAGPTKFYQQMHDAEVAKALATGHSSMGVADLIIQQFEATLDRGEAAPENSGALPAVMGTGHHRREPKHPVIGPPAPQAMDRYQSMSPVGNSLAERQKLRFFAEQNGAAVADTLGRFESEINSAALKSGVEPSLILAVVMEESAGDPMALSNKGARGLMQLMPGTARELGVNDSFSPGQNLQGGATYLSRMLKKFDGDLELALAAYNAGPGNVEKAGNKVPNFPETQRYVQAVRQRYQDLGGGTKMANE